MTWLQGGVLCLIYMDWHVKLWSVETAKCGWSRATHGGIMIWLSFSALQREVDCCHRWHHFLLENYCTSLDLKILFEIWSIYTNHKNNEVLPLMLSFFFNWWEISNLIHGGDPFWILLNKSFSFYKAKTKSQISLKISNLCSTMLLQIIFTKKLGSLWLFHPMKIH